MAWDLLVQDWGTQNWSKGGQGTAEISPAGQLHLLRNTNTTDSVYVFNDLGTLPDDYTVEFKACMDDYKNGGLLAHQFYDGTHRCMIQIFVDKVYNPDSTTSIACTNTAGVWYTWRILIDSSSHIMKVYRNGVYLGDLGGGLNYTSGDGTVYVECGTPASISCELHEDYLYVGTGLFASIARTVVEKLGGVDVVTKFKGAIHLSTEILGGVDYVSRVLGLTIVVTDEDLSTHSGFEYDEVTYTATVLDSHGNPLPSNFLVSLEYKEIETHLVLNQPLDDSVYNQVTGLLTLIWHVPSGDTDSYTVVLEWSTQENIWLNGWSYRRFHQINPATGAGTNYQKRFVALYNSGSWKNIRFANEVATIPPPSGFQFISGQTATYWDGTLLHVWFGASSDGTSDHDCIFYTNSSVPFTIWATPVKVIDNRDIGLGMRDPTSLKVGTTLYIFIQTYDSVLGKANAVDLFKIVNVDSIDLTDPDSYTWVDAIIELGAGGAFDDTVVASPCAMESGGTYYLVYEAMKNDGTYSIGLAHSADCESWTKDGQLLDVSNNPIVNPIVNTQAIVPCVFNSSTKLYVHIARAGGGKITLRAVTGDFAGNEVALESYELDPQIDGYWNHNALSETAVDVVDFRDRTIYLLGAWSSATYYLRVYVDYDCFACDTNCETDFDDIRFTNGDGQTLLDYWLEQKTDSDYAIFWVEIIDSLESNPFDMYCYYGNSTAPSISDIATTSLWGLGDDFNDDSRDAKWTVGIVNTGIVDETNEKLEISALVNGDEAWYVTTDSKDMSGCVIRLKIRNNQNLGQMGLWIIPTKYTDVDLYSQSEWYRVLVYGDGNLYIQSKTGGTLYSGAFLAQTDMIVIKIVDGHIYFYEQDSTYPWLIYLRADEAYSLSNTTAYIYLEGRCDNGAKLGPEVHEDFFSRKMIITEPTQGEWGDVESQG